MSIEVKCPACHSDNAVDSLFCRKCGSRFHSPGHIIQTEKMTAMTPSGELTEGSTFTRRYQVIEELGTGGMGKVYKVRDKDIDRIVALKLIKPEISTQKKNIERFKNELKLTRDITHKNVCRMYDLNREGDTYFITMEYVPGEDLKDFIRRAAPLSISRAISIARQVCEGLAEAHKLGVVHRDLKSNNIMIDKEGNVRIMDFGIAFSMKAKGITGSGVMIGTPEYMSPEQVEAKKVDARSDIYSTGVLLYEMLTGQLPFAGDTPLSIAMKQKGEKPVAPQELNPQIPLELNRLVLKCLEKDKGKRYQDVTQLIAELDSIEKSMPETGKITAKSKLSTAKEITLSLNLRKLLIPVLVVFAVILVVLTIWIPWSNEKSAPIPSDKVSIAVLYFKNNSGDPSLDIWRNALAESLISDLHQSKYIKVLSADRLFSILKEFDLLERQSYTTEELNKIASEGQINHLLLGSFSKAGDIFRIETTHHDINSGEVIHSERVEGAGEKSFFSMIDELTRRIKLCLNLSAKLIANDIDRDIGEISTSSSEAYKHYSAGRKYMQMLEHQQGLQFMEKAIAKDPEFAMAYRSMAVCYKELGNEPKWLKSIKKAFELSDRLPKRENYIIQGDFYRRSEKTYDKAIKAYTKLLQVYPYNVFGNNGLGNLYLGLEEWDKAIERYEVLIENKEENPVPYSNIVKALRARGFLEKAKTVLEDYLTNYSDHFSIHLFLADIYLSEAKYDLALSEVNKAFSLAPGNIYIIRLKGRIDLCKANFKEAEEEYQKIIKPEEKPLQRLGRYNLASLYLTQGRFEESIKQLQLSIEIAKEIGDVNYESFFHLSLSSLYLRSKKYKKALDECNQAWDIAVEKEILNHQNKALFLKTHVFIEMGSMEKAEDMADVFKKEIEKRMNKKLIRMHFNLLGMIEFKKSNFSKAIKYFKKAILLLPFPYSSLRMYVSFIEPLALTYFRAGDLDKALEEYKKITTLTIGRIEYGDIYARSFYMLGKICQKKGWEGKAIEHFRTFLNLWKDADPGITEVEDAKKRLAELSG